MVNKLIVWIISILILSSFVSAQTLILEQTNTDTYEFVRTDRPKGQGIVLNNGTLDNIIFEWQEHVDGDSKDMIFWIYNSTPPIDITSNIEHPGCINNTFASSGNQQWVNISFWNNCTLGIGNYTIIATSTDATNVGMTIESGNFYPGIFYTSTDSGASWSDSANDYQFYLFADITLDLDDNINISPGSIDNHTQFNTSTIHINLTVNSTFNFNCSMDLNGTINSTINSTGGLDISMNYSLTLNDGTWNYTILCVQANDSSISKNTTRNTFYIDLISPTIKVINWTDNALYYKNNITGKFNFTDESNLFSFNITVDGVNIDGQTNINQLSYLYNLSLDPTTYSPGQHTIGITIRDGHTKEELKGDYKVKNGLFNNYLKFQFDGVYEKGFVQIYQKDAFFDQWNAEKYKNKYSFKFKPSKKKSSYQFIVESSDFIYIIENQNTKYKQWLVSQEKWIDFMPYTDVKFKRLNDKEIEVTINGIDPDQNEIIFNSIGDLNTITQTYNFSIINATIIYSPFVTENEVQTMALNISKLNPSDTSSATLTYNGTVYSPTLQAFATNDYYFFNFITPLIDSSSILQPFFWNFSVFSTSNLTTSTETINQTVFGINIASCATGDKLINFTLYDENNLTLLNGTIEAEIIITSGTTEILTYANSTIDGSNLIICLNNISAMSGNFQLEVIASYESANYVKEYWHLDNGSINISCQFNNYTSCDVSLYNLLLDDSTSFLFTFLDEFGLSVDDAIIHTFRQYISEGVFYEIERSRQDENGETHIHLIEEDAIYYFMVSQYGKIVYISDSYHAKCLSTPCAIELDASDEFTPISTDWENIDGTFYSIDTNKTSRVVTLTFTSNATRLINFSLYSYDNNDPVLINQSTLTAITGNIPLTVPLIYGNTSFFTAIYADEVLAKSQWVDFNYNAQDIFGVTGAILSGFIIISIGLMALSEGVILVVAVSIALFLIGILALIDLPWLSLISILCAGGILIYKIIKKRGGE